MAADDCEKMLVLCVFMYCARFGIRYQIDATGIQILFEVLYGTVLYHTLPVFFFSKALWASWFIVLIGYWLSIFTIFYNFYNF